MKKVYKHALALPSGPTSILRSAWVVLGMQTSSWLPMASLGQTITTHQEKQLGVTKISSPCDRVPMFGLIQPNLTHFVHTIEANWRHAVQFCRSPPSTSYTPNMQVVVLLTCCHWFEQRPRWGSNEQENWGNQGEHVARQRDKWALWCRSSSENTVNVHQPEFTC